MVSVGSDFTFSHQRLNNVDLAKFSYFFDQLVPDLHIDGHYRKRRYSRFVQEHGTPQELEREAFYQSRHYNDVNGGILRKFEPLEKDLIALPEFRQLIDAVSHFFGYDPGKTVLGVHQIRITCSSDETGQPVPEGIHQDGFDLIAICCIERHNVAGATSQLYTNPKAKPVYDCIMQPGDIIYCNDRVMYHYASPMEPEDGRFPGHRDIFVITVTLEEQQWQRPPTDLSPDPSDQNFPHYNV